MRSSEARVLVSLLVTTALALAGMSGCGQSLVSGRPNGTTLPPLSGSNVLSLTVNGSSCNAANSYPNKPCVSVTVCAPGSSTNCQTVNDVLVDTGSYGFRVFKSVLNASLASALTQQTSGSSSIAECVQFGDGTADWGPVQNANIVLGGESAVQVPIQVIDSGFASVPSSCPSPETSPSVAGYNAILGVGVFLQDCGPNCVTQSKNNVYFACSGTSCTSTTESLLKQVQNPVALLSADNNGVVIELPNVPLGGVPYANGYLVLGVGTQSDNGPSGVTAFPADATTGNFTTSFNGNSYATSFLDTGSNGLFFPAPSSSTLPDCGSSNASLAGWFCPSSTQSFTADTIGSTGSPTSQVAFEVGNMLSLDGSGNNVFVEAAGNGAMGGTVVFDWGLPFYIGRNVYQGFETKSSSLGSGPYWAY